MTNSIKRASSVMTSSRRRSTRSTRTRPSYRAERKRDARIRKLLRRSERHQPHPPLETSSAPIATTSRGHAEDGRKGGRSAGSSARSLLQPVGHPTRGNQEVQAGNWETRVERAPEKLDRRVS